MDISLHTGDSKNLIINVVDGNNSPIDLTNATIEWILADKDTTVLAKSIGNGITVNIPTNGQFKISLTSSNTKNLSGVYTHMARVTTFSGDSSIILEGTITITKTLI
jgi:hypothetical protein